MEDGEKYSWWKVVVALVVFCAMAGVILYILRVTESSNCKNELKSRCCCYRVSVKQDDDNDDETPTIILTDTYGRMRDTNV